MGNRGMIVRCGIVVVVLLGSTVLLHAMSHGEPMMEREPLKDLSYQIGNWQGKEYPLEQRIVQAVSVTDYTNRVYTSSSAAPVELYVGYYASQRTGDTIHSPKNCLPGAGWDPIHAGYATIPVQDGKQITVNEYVIAQGLQRQLVFYWYQGRGRVIASEYWGKFWMIHDAITRNRTDGALVRLITPIIDNNTPQAYATLEKFTKLIFPSLVQFIPD